MRLYNVTYILVLEVRESCQNRNYHRSPCRNVFRLCLMVQLRVQYKDLIAKPTKGKNVIRSL